MKNILLVVVLTLVLTALVVTPVAAKKAVFIPLDYDGDGVYDCQYTVSDRCDKKNACMMVSYFGFDYDYLGHELWTGYWGLMEDTFEPWTYPFPEC